MRLRRRSVPGDEGEECGLNFLVANILKVAASINQNAALTLSPHPRPTSVWKHTHYQCDQFFSPVHS